MTDTVEHAARAGSPDPSHPAASIDPDETAAATTSRRDRLLRALTPASLWQRTQHWLLSTPHSTISFSIFRVLMGAAMLAVLVPSTPDRHYLWGFGSWWVEPEASRRGWWEPLRMLFSKESALLFDIVYTLLVVLVVVFILGWKTRWVTPVLLVLWVGLSTNSTLLTNGGDTLMRIALLFAVFARLSDHFSIDAWLRRRRSRRGLPEPRALVRRPAWLPAWVGTWLHNTVLVLCVYQILLVYLVSSVLKLEGEEWLNGSALYYALSLEQFQVLPLLSEIAWQSTPMVMVATWIALWVQLLFPILIFWRPSRYVALVLITGMHLGIALFLGLWPFSLAMISLDLLLVRDSSWRKAWGYAQHVGRSILSPSAGRTTA
jgi:hypothetical protein